jgi:hypothetical protein
MSKSDQVGDEITDSSFSHPLFPLLFMKLLMKIVRDLLPLSGREHLQASPILPRHHLG